MLQVDERNQDDLSRLAGCYLYTGTHINVEDGAVHREDGPAVIFPDGVMRWYVRGKEVTRAVNTLFYENKWPIAKGLDTAEKRARFAATFLTGMSSFPSARNLLRKGIDFPRSATPN
jgi:hypothetical protein